MSVSASIPFLRIQHDWQQGLKKGEKVWISCSVPEQSSIYGSVFGHAGKETAPQATDDFDVTLLNQAAIRVSCRSQQVSSVFQAPHRTFRNIHKKAVRCIDVSAGAALGISSSDNGGLFIWDTSDGVVRRSLEGHISDVIHCRFFPSGVVALSGGIDMQLRIWSAENAKCARVLIGHKGAITDTAIIEQGKTFISCSRDGTAKLWNCGRGVCDSTLIDCGCVINSCSLSSPYSSQDAQEDTPSHESSFLSGKILAVGREDGIISFVDIQSTSELFQPNCVSAVNCCTFVGEHDIFAGCQSGELFQFDLRNMSTPVSVISIGNSPIHYVSKFFNHITLSRGDGSVQLIDTSNLLETIQLTGANADAIYRICSHGNVVYSASRDGAIRKYQMNILHH